MEWLLQVINSLWWVNIVLAVIVVFLGRHRNPKSTLMWVMVLTFIPYMGFVFYLTLGQDYTKRKMFALKEEEDRMISDISSFQSDFISTGRYWYNNEKSYQYDDLIKLNLKLDESFYTQDNAIDLFFWGEDKFRQLEKDLKNAEHSIDIQYYIFKADEIGQRILRVLEEKAAEGVHVRLLIDAVGSRKLTKKHLSTLIANGGEVSVFFPSLLPVINLRLNYRNHRKLVIIDDFIGYVGGFNVGDDYMGKYKRFGPWRDTHARIIGTGVIGLKYRFMKDWHYASQKEVEDLKISNRQLSEEGKSGVQIVTSGPDTAFENIKNAFFRMIMSAEKSIYIQTPYFIPDESILESLKSAIITGVDVNIMIPKMPDHPFVYWATYSYVGDLIRVGAKVYTYQKGFLHAKVMAVDDYISTIGSANMDIRSFALNFEVNALIYDEEINRKLVEQFHEDLKDSELLTLEKYNNRGKVIKVKEAFSRLLSPIL